MDVQTIAERINMTNDLSDEKRLKLAQIIEERHENLITSIRVLIWKMGMSATIKEADDLAHGLPPYLVPEVM